MEPLKTAPASIQPIISTKLLRTISDIYTNALVNISEKYNINEKELKNEFKLDSTKIAIELGIKKRNRRVLDDTKRCLGRKFDGNQCTRSRRDDSDFCLSHEKNLPQGRIDDGEFKPKEKGKRGRKKKLHAFANNDEYLATTLIEINNCKYLIDNSNNIYTFNIEQPEYKGQYDSITNKIKNVPAIPVF
jgi:hypothetical protein